MHKDRRTADNDRTLDRRSLLRLGAGLAIGVAVAPRTFSIATGVTRPIKTSNGPVRGLIDEGVNTFLGIRYGSPPVGKLRFMPPQRPAPSSELQDTMRYAASAMQLASGGSAVRYPGTVGPALGQVFGSPEDRLRQDEDCLFLNVWTPGLADGRRRPVMVWLHGGGFNYGSGSWPAYDGHNLANSHDVVSVSVNHRLNAFGFLGLGELGGESFAYSANAGQLDLVAALEWVRDNIEEFGGDPDNVTVFGQSGGGAKVSVLLAMPSAKGLLHRAVIQSGPSLRGGRPEAAAETAKAVLRELGVSARNVEQLQEVPADDLLAAAVRSQRGSPRSMRFGPVTDGDVLPADPFDPDASPLAADIPLMIGWTKDERTLYNVGMPWWGKLTDDELLEKATEAVGPKAEALVAAFRKLRPRNSPSYLYTDVTTTRFSAGSITLAERKAAQRAAVYLYRFDWEAPVDDGILKAPHTMEIPFAFDNVDKGPILLGTALSTKRLGTLVSSVWTRFARTGNPNVPGLPQWPRYDEARRATMLFDVESRVVDDPDAEVRRILLA